MRIPIQCFECARLVATGGSTTEASRWFGAVFDDNLTHVGECASGHQLRIALMNTRYELLYDQAIMSLHLEFYREALSGCATALERFFEYASRVMLLHLGVPEDALERGWKAVNRSEPQQGGFLLLYLACFHRPFAPPAGVRTLGSMATPRNDVVHNGWIPSCEETLRYAKEVFEIVHAVRADLLSLPSALELMNRVNFMTSIRRANAAIEDREPPPQRSADGLFRGSASFTFGSMLGGAPQTAESLKPQGRPAVAITFDERFAESVVHARLWFAAFD
jgi:hypothetical protein